MPKRLPEDLDARIAAEISRHREGIGIVELSKVFAGIVSRRTLQRRLIRLTRKGHISAKGEGRARTYLALATSDVSISKSDIRLGQKPEAPDIEVYVPTSEESQHVVSYIRRPIQQRQPVGYDRLFLELYRPNETFYLSPEIRDHLYHIGRPPDGPQPAGTYARDILNRLLIDLSWASSRLEGNTYSRLDTQNLIEHGQAAEGKDRREAQMILNHKDAIELLVEQAEEIGFNTFTFLNLHALLSANLLADPGEGGRLRNRIVEVSGTVFHPLSIPQQIEHYFRLILEKADAIADPFEQAFFIMVHIPYLQPFVDVNKRVSRLGANISLIRHNLCPLSFIDVPEKAYVEGTLGVYEMKQAVLLGDVFLWAYERSSQRYLAIQETVAEPNPVRLRYREALIVIIGEIVRGQQRPSEAAVREVAKSLALSKDLDDVIALALEDLKHLHEGNVSRYRLRLSEYRAWLPLQEYGGMKARQALKPGRR